MAMIPTIIYKIFAFRTPCSDAVFIQNMFNCYDIFKKIFVELVLNKTHIAFIKDY